MPSDVIDLLIISVIMFGCLAIAWVLVTQISKARLNDEGKRRLEHENGALKLEMSKLIERVAVLERIATDPATRMAREIEDLRSRPDACEPADQQASRRPPLPEE